MTSNIEYLTESKKKKKKRRFPLIVNWSHYLKLSFEFKRTVNNLVCTNGK